MKEGQCGANMKKGGDHMKEGQCGASMMRKGA
jgi:exosome complex RNA-binding protein Csl4